MDFFKKYNKRKDITRIIFDITDESVGCAIFSFTEKNAKPHIHFVSRIPLSLKGELTKERLLKATGITLRALSEHVQQFISTDAERFRIAEIACVLSSRWHSTKTHIEEKKEETPFSVSLLMIEGMVNQSMKEINKEEKQSYKEKHIEDPIIFERRVLSIALNGYKVAKPIGKDATKIEISLFNAVMDRALYKMLHEILEAQFGHVAISFHSHILSLFTVIRDYLYINNNFVIIDIGSKTTDVTFVAEETLDATISLPIGTKHTLHTIAKQKGGTLEEAHSLLCMTDREDYLDRSSKEYKIIENAGAVWQREVTTALSKLTKGLVARHQLFVTAPHCFITWYAYLATHLYEHDADEKGSASMLTTTVLSSDLVCDFITVKRGVKFDTMLFIEILHNARL
ncbi:MAG TPA: hypothetical protein VJH21_00960 [Candidatus Paceibacterota bacterium]